MEPPALPTTILSGLLERVTAAGHDPGETLETAGIDPAVFEDPEGRVPAAAALKLWDEAARITADPHLGLHVAEDHHEALGVFEYALRAADTLGDAWRRGCRYFKLMHPDTEPELVDVGGTTVMLRFNMPSILPRYIPDQIMASFLLRGREATGRDWSPDRVLFTYPEPDDTGELRRIFRSNLRFRAETNALVLQRELLDLHQRTADAGLSVILAQYAEELIGRLPDTEDVVSRVQRRISRELSNGDPGVEGVARALGMSQRTLHRRLREHETSYREILEELRYDLAMRHLEARTLSVGEIAFLLGYSETSTFHRAFKRWSGCSPSEHQARCRAS